MHGRSRINIDPRIPTMPGRRTSGFHRPGRHCLHQARSAVRCWACRMQGELHPTVLRACLNLLRLGWNGWNGTRLLVVVRSIPSCWCPFWNSRQPSNRPEQKMTQMTFAVGPQIYRKASLRAGRASHPSRTFGKSLQVMISPSRLDDDS